MSFGAGHGLEAVRLVKEGLEAQPLLGPIVLALKSLLEQKAKRVFNNGCITSYGLFILAARFLRDWSSHASRARAPTAPTAAAARSSLPPVLRARFQPRGAGRALRRGQPGGRLPSRQHPTLAQFRCDSLYLRDPIDPQNNVGSNATASTRSSARLAHPRRARGMTRSRAARRPRVAGAPRAHRDWRRRIGGGATLASRTP